MCIFRVVSKVHSFQEFIDLNPDFPVYKTHEKGEKMDIGKEDLLYEDYGIYVEVSDRSWRDIEGQTIDMISFLEVYGPFLETLRTTHQVDDWRFDIPYECQLNDTNYVQCNYLSPKLIKKAASLDIGIELSLYRPAEEEEEAKAINDKTKLS